MGVLHFEGGYIATTELVNDSFSQNFNPSPCYLNMNETTSQKTETSLNYFLSAT
jgi:hypothetical protein